MPSSDHRLVLLRHGETAWSRLGRHTGVTDVPLTPAGEQQARRLRHRLAALGLRQPLVLTSPRQRAQSTAERAGLVVDGSWEALVEWDYGEYEGLTTPEIQSVSPQWTVWTHPCPGGETHDMVAARADMVIRTCAATLPERDVLLIGHGHFSRALIARWIEQPVTEGRRFVFSPAAVTVLGYEHEFPTVLNHNLLPTPTPDKGLT